jgi:homocysteine S-methyltransferase
MLQLRYCVINCDQRVIKLDGGLSTALENNGNTLTSSLWTGELIRSNPSEITKAHLDFINAGAQIIISSSYQLSYPGCSKRGWSEEETDQALITSTALAKNAVKESGKDVKVAASIGPFGASLADGSEYKGNYGISKQELKKFHARRLEVLLTTSPDYLALETMPDTFEVEVLLELLSNCAIPFWISYSCKEGNQTNAGQSFQSAVDLAQDAMAVGINCTKPELITDLLKDTKSNKPFVVYPNSGRVWDAQKKVWLGDSKIGFSEQILKEWIEAGAEIIGGCCGIGAGELAEIRF